MMRPFERPFFLMYAHIALVTSVRGIFGFPQIAARSFDRVFGAKMPSPFFFMSAARFAPAAFVASLFLPLRFFSFFGAVFLITFFATFFAVFFATFFAAIGAIMVNRPRTS